MQYKTKILIIYTGGTIGMVSHPETGALAPFDFDRISEQVPALKKFGYELTTISFDPVIDSSNVSPQIWIKIAKTILDNPEYEGYVILHGTDTMAYSAAALSFMLEFLHKPVILTGSQLPIETLRTDGKENLITTIEIAAAKRNGKPIVPEVCIYFENKLYRGNRTTKHNAEYFNAFKSDNYPPLAEAGIHINFNYQAIYQPANRSGRTGILYIPRLSFNTNVAILKFFPGMTQKAVEAIINIPDLQGLIIESFGAGNVTTENWFTECIIRASEKGIIMLNVTQCSAGSVEMGLYETSVGLVNAGVISGYDITIEAAITKMMFLLGQQLTKEEVIMNLKTPIAGEMTIPENIT